MCGYLYVAVFKLVIYQITATGKQTVLNADVLFTFYATWNALSFEAN